MSKNLDTAIFAAGCFWCYEAVFQRVKGVESVMPGYTGGDVSDPSYRLVTTGSTGHAEAIRIEYHPEVVDYSTLLEVFWAVHDPTQLNKQGNDVGTQYRSAIFHLNDEQKKIAEESKANAQNDYDKPIVTEITEATEFFEAEDYHKDYFENNPNAGYCQIVISPKVKKFQEKFPDLLK